MLGLRDQHNNISDPMTHPLGGTILDLQKYYYNKYLAKYLRGLIVDIQMEYIENQAKSAKGFVEEFVEGFAEGFARGFVKINTL